MLTRSLARLASAALVTALAGCGGGGGGGSAIFAPRPAASSPAPAPRGVPFPGCAPAVFSSYGAMATAPATAVADGATVRYTGLQAPIELVGAIGDVRFTCSAPNTWSIDIDGWGGPQFSPADLVSPASTRFDSWRTVNQGFVENLDIAKPGATGLALTYTGIVVQASGVPFASTAVFSFHAPGVNVTSVRTPLTWGGIADGFWFDGTTTRRLFGSTATITLDQGGSSTLAMTLRGHADPFGAFESTPTTPLGSFTGAGRRPAGPGGVTLADGAIALANGYSGPYLGSVCIRAQRRGDRCRLPAHGPGRSARMGRHRRPPMSPDPAMGILGPSFRSAPPADALISANATASARARHRARQTVAATPRPRLRA